MFKRYYRLFIANILCLLIGYTFIFIMCAVISIDSENKISIINKVILSISFQNKNPIYITILSFFLILLTNIIYNIEKLRRSEELFLASIQGIKEAYWVTMNQLLHQWKIKRKKHKQRSRDKETYRLQTSSQSGVSTSESDYDELSTANPMGCIMLIPLIPILFIFSLIVNYIFIPIYNYILRHILRYIIFPLFSIVYGILKLIIIIIYKILKFIIIKVVPALLYKIYTKHIYRFRVNARDKSIILPKDSTLKNLWFSRTFLVIIGNLILIDLSFMLLHLLEYCNFGINSWWMSWGISIAISYPLTNILISTYSRIFRRWNNLIRAKSPSS